MINDILGNPILMPNFYFKIILYFWHMSRKNAKNIKSFNDKLHKAQDKEKAKKTARSEQLKVIVKKFNESKEIP
jgi:hypothetical protein